MPLKELTPMQLGYIAGIIDGEGCIRIRQNGKTGNGCVSLHVANTDLEVLNILKEWTGLGFVYQSRKKKYNSNTCRALYAWELSPKDCNELLVVISDLLIIKQKQAKYALLYQQLIVEGKGRPTKENLDTRIKLASQIKAEKYKGEYLAD